MHVYLQCTDVRGKQAVLYSRGEPECRAPLLAGVV